MGIAGDQVVAVIDFYHVAVGCIEFLRHHHATGRGMDRGADFGWVIQASVQRRGAGKWVNPPAEARAQITTRDRLLGGVQHAPHFLVEQARLHHRHPVGPLPSLLQQGGHGGLDVLG